MLLNCLPALPTRQERVRRVGTVSLVSPLKGLAQVSGKGTSGDGPLQVLCRTELFLAAREVLLGLRERLADLALAHRTHYVAKGEEGVVAALRLVLLGTGATAIGLPLKLETGFIAFMNDSILFLLSSFLWSYY